MSTTWTRGCGRASWPGCCRPGAADAWLVPIVMKKGRPAHTLCVLCRPAQAATLREVVFASTTTIGIREQVRPGTPCRGPGSTSLAGGSVAVKIAHRAGRVVQVTPEFESVAAYANEHGQSEQHVMSDAAQAAISLGYAVGEPWPPPGTG